MKFALFLLAFLWSFSQGNGGGSQTSALSKHAIRLASIRLFLESSYSQIRLLVMGAA